MSTPAPFTEQMIQHNAAAMGRAQGVVAAMAGLSADLARAVADPQHGLRIELRTRANAWVPLDGVNAQAAAAERAGQIGEASQVLLVGVGLGYTLEALEARGSVAKVLVVEPDPGVATLFLARRDWSQWFDSGRLRLLVGPAYGGATSLARWLDVTGTPVISLSPVLAAERPKSAAAAQAIAQRVMDDAMANLDARRRFAGRYLLQTLGNLPVIVGESDASALDGLFAGTPAVVVGAGPSLDENLPALKRLQDRAVIIAADTTLRPLLAGGVSPHLVVGVDPAELNARHLSGVGTHDTTWLVAEGSLHPSAFEGFRGRTFTFRVSQHEPWPWLDRHGAGRGSLRAWGSVITSAFDLALRLGSNPVVFAGLDLAYTAERPYCSNTLYDTTWRDVLMAYHGWTFEQLVADYFANRATSWEPDLRGVPVRTAPQLLSFRNWLLDQMAAPSGRRFVNATGGGLLFGPGVEQGSLDEALGGAPVVADVSDRLRAAYEAGRRPHGVTADRLREAAAGQSPDSAALLDAWQAFTLDTTERTDVQAALLDAADRLIPSLT